MNRGEFRERGIHRVKITDTIEESVIDAVRRKRAAIDEVVGGDPWAARPAPSDDEIMHAATSWAAMFDIPMSDRAVRNMRRLVRAIGAGEARRVAAMQQWARRKGRRK